MAESLAPQDFHHPRRGATSYRPPAIIAAIAFPAMLPLTPCCNAESIYSHARSLLKAPILTLVLGLLVLPGSALAGPQPGLAMHGEPLEAKGFTHFPYVNPDAPKGGRVTFAVQGSFDSLNPLIVKGAAADGVREYIYESLLARANDEPFSLYGLIAESVETPADRSFVEFTLRPEAKFSDGTPDHRRGRDLLARAVARSWAAQSPLLLQEGHQGGARRASARCDSRSMRAATARCRSSSG